MVKPQADHLRAVPAMQTSRSPLLTNLLRVLGTWVGGDLGPFTLYTTRSRKLVWYPRSPPTMPASVAQRRQRDRFTLAVQRWRTLPASERVAWESLATQLGLVATGHNLYLHLALNYDAHSWQTAATKTGTLLLPPEVIPR